MSFKKRPGPYDKGLCARSLGSGTPLRKRQLEAGDVNVNQNLLGGVALAQVEIRHEDSVSGLAETEWLDLHRQLKRPYKGRYGSALYAR